jgi:glycerol-3-phosphate dehydrogenase
LGLTLYDLLAGMRSFSDSHRYFSKAEFAGHFPCLDTSALVSGFTYLDAQTDDARFVLEVIDGASATGAVCLNYCEVTGFIEQEGQVCGVQVLDKVSGRVGRVHARQIVNTTGQWLAATKQGQESCRLTKGVHLILPKVLNNEALLLTAEQDGRVFFMIPWYGLTLLGTTDTDFRGDIEHVKVEKNDIRYLLNEANRVLKTVNWTESDIIGQFAGLRVLKQSPESAPSSVSRDWELKTADNGLLISIGGKFTSAREDAAHIVDKICETLKLDAPCRTFGRSFPWLPETEFKGWAESAKGEAIMLGIDEECADWLIRRHGRRVAKIFSLIENNPAGARRIFSGLPFIVADLVFSAHDEMIVHLEDLIRRRMPLLVLARMRQAEILQLAEIVARELNWSEKTVKEEVEFCCQNWLQTTIS